MTCKIEYHDFPANREDDAKELVEIIKPLLPAWLRHLTVCYKPTEPEDGGIACVNVDLDYLQTTLTICRSLFEEPRESWRRYLTHEAIHIVLSPLATCAEDAVDSAFPESQRGPAHHFMKLKLEEALEAVTQEMSYLIEEMRANQ